MAAIKLQDFADLVRSIRNELKIQSTDVESLNRIKQTLNMVYVDEIVPFKRWWWLLGSADIQTIPYYADGTSSVTPSSTSVTLSVAPPVANGSLKDYYFSTDNHNELYTISSHTAGSTAITLSKPYTGSLAATAKFKIWTDKLALPTDLRETVEVRHDFSNRPMDGLGFQEFRRVLANSPKAQGKPTWFNVTDYRDPTPLTGESESDRFRLIQVYPAVYNSPVTLHVDYTREVSWLDDDSDEPLMPLEDRIVLYYGALAQLWTSLMRNPEEAARNYALYQNKLNRMAGKIEEGFDKPVMQPDSFYFKSKRGVRIKSGSARNFRGIAGGSGANIPTYAKNITIEGGIFTANMTASPGVTIDGRDLSVDGAALDAHIAAATDVHGVGVGNAVVGDATTQTLTNKTIAVASNDITDVTANSVATFNASNKLIGSSTVNTTELSYLDNVVPLSAVALADNQVSAADVLSMAATFDSVQISYSIKRGSANIETGQILLTNDGTNASIAVSAASLGSPGVTFSADISAGNVRLRYTSTNTGTAPSFQYKLQRWVA